MYSVHISFKIAQLWLLSMLCQDSVDDLVAPDHLDLNLWLLHSRSHLVMMYRTSEYSACCFHHRMFTSIRIFLFICSLSTLLHSWIVTCIELCLITCHL